MSTDNRLPPPTASKSRRSPFTQKRAEALLKAAKSAGWRSVKIRPDGSVIISDDALASIDDDLDQELRDFEAKH
jgi:hypothetical protein